MTITKTYEIPADHRITVPREVPTGATTRVEFNIIPFPKKEGEPATSPKLRFSKSELNDLLENSPTPHTDALMRLFSGINCDMTLEQIREERLAKHLK